MTRGSDPSGSQVEIFEVGPRDGLQNESNPVPLEQKVALIDALSGTGFRRIEAGAFVRADRVPQMAGSGDVFRGIRRAPGVRYAALVPNLTGLAAARDAQVDEIAVFGSASEGFSRANLGMSVDDSLALFDQVAETALDDGLPVRGYVSCIAECPFDGSVNPAAVVRAVLALRAMGCYEVSLGDTLGRATPGQIENVMNAVLRDTPPNLLAGHFHDTDGGALANVDVALAAGVRVFDASIAGLGGCPYAPGAPGNVGTGELNDHLIARGFETGLDRAALASAETLSRKIVQGDSNVPDT